MADNEMNDILTLTTEIVSAFVGNSAHVKAEELPQLIRTVRAALMEEAAPQTEPQATTPKATRGQISKSITPDGLISFIDGKSYKTLKRHLTRHGHDLKSYQEAYGLPNDYPSVAASYSATRSAMAKSLGLGANGRGRPKAAAAAAAPKPRKKAAASPDA